MVLIYFDHLHRCTEQGVLGECNALSLILCHRNLCVVAITTSRCYNVHQMGKNYKQSGSACCVRRLHGWVVLRTCRRQREPAVLAARPCSRCPCCLQYTALSTSHQSFWIKMCPAPSAKLGSARRRTSSLQGLNVRLAQPQSILATLWAGTRPTAPAKSSYAWTRMLRAFRAPM